MKTPIYSSLLMLALMVMGLPAARAASVIYVSTSGSDANNGQTIALAKLTIQAGVSAVAAGGIVYIEPGTYSGAGDVNVDPGGHNMTIESDAASGGDTANTIIDLEEQDQPAFEFGPGQTSSTLLFGLTIENAKDDAGNGGALSIGYSSPTIQNCVFYNNEAAFGGAMTIADAGPTIRECTFTDNRAVDPSLSIGGAIEVESTNEVTSGTFTTIITNCVFTGNTATTDGAAIDVSNGLQPIIVNADITNCTFTQNTSTYTDEDDPGGAVGVYSANVTFINDILWADTVTTNGQGGEIAVVPAGGATAESITAGHSDIQQSSGTYPGSVNINTDPLLAAGFDLGAGSPAINAGTTSVPAGVDISIDRTGRARDSQPDLGAYEVLAPTANAQSVTDEQNTATNITLTGADPNVTTRPLTFAVQTDPAHGALSGAAPNLTYKPNADYTGPDSFTFTVNNGTYGSSPATVSITVLGQPTADSQSVSVAFNTAQSVTLTGSDPNTPPEALTYNVETQPAHGTLSGTAPNLTYTPNAGYQGADSFTFTVTNSSDLTSTAATVSLNIAAGAPTAQNENISVGDGKTAKFDMLGTDPNTPPLHLTYAVVSAPGHGVLTTNGSKVVYVPSAGYYGLDSFQYTASNGVLTSNTATVSITVLDPVPVIKRIVPDIADGPETVTVYGDGFMPSSQITWQGTAIPTTYLSPTELIGSPTSSLAADQGEITLTVVNPSPGGGPSNSLSFTQPFVHLVLHFKSPARRTGTITVPLEIDNIGGATATNVVVTIATATANGIITTAESLPITVGSIAANTLSTVTLVFDSTNLPSGATVTFGATAVSDEFTANSTKVYTLP